MKLRTTLELALRQCVFIILNIYAISKILGGQFYLRGKLPEEVANTTLANVSNFTIAWTFMGHSFAYILFIGISQLVGAWSLLWNKTKLLGVLILLPIMVNIILFDIIFLDVYPALANALICFAMLLLILFFSKERVLVILQTMTDFPKKPTGLFKKRMLALAMTIIALVMIYCFDTLIEYQFGASKEKIVEY